MFVKLEKALDALQGQRFPQAKTYLSMIEKNMKDKVKNYPQIDELKDILKKYNQAKDMASSEDPRAQGLIKTILEDLKKVEPQIEKFQIPTRGPAVAR